MYKKLIRLAQQQDQSKVEEVMREAFWNLYMPGCDEHYVAHILPGHADFIPELYFVAEVDGQVVGSIMYTKSKIVDAKGNQKEVATFGPIAVLPKFQRKGIGTELIKQTKYLVKKMGYKAIIILGHPYNYCKHGFRSCRDFKVTDNQGRYPFGQLVLELEKDFLKDKQWKFHPSSVYQVNQAKVLEFDKAFAPKEKLETSSQVEFEIACRAYLD